MIDMYIHSKQLYSNLMLIITCLWITVPALCPIALSADDFGKNKIQYEQFDFTVLNTPNFNIYYYPKESSYILTSAQMLERWYHRYKEIFGVAFNKRQPIILYANHPDFQQTNIISGFLPQGVGGVTEGRRNRVIIPLSGINSSNNHVLGHEMIHVFQFALSRSTQFSYGAMDNLPLWFIEGLAEYLSIGPISTYSAMYLKDAVVEEELPSLFQMSRNPQFSPYRFGHSVWAYIAGRWGRDKLVAFFHSSMESGWEQASEDVFGLSSRELSEAWENEVTSWAKALLRREGRIPDRKKAIIADEKSTIRLSPSISPDGKKIAYFSQRSPFSIELLISDMQSGEPISSLGNSTLNTHFDALRFLDSAGAWSPHSDRFAFTVIKNGDHSIAIADIDDGTITTTLQFETVDSISTITWAPDGNSLVFSGHTGGISDLYLYRFESDRLQKLTDDLYSDIQPNWSPDGEEVVFVSDRGDNTRLETYTYSPLTLTFYNLSTKEIRTVAFGENTEVINPCYSPNGNSVFFVADYNGTNNIYRYSLTEDTFYQITDATIGVTGPTQYSPALSVSTETGNLVFSVFNKGEFSLHQLSAEDIDKQTVSATTADIKKENTLPPTFENSRWDPVSDYLGEAKEGLQEPSTFTTNPYRPLFSLASLGYVSVGLSSVPSGVQFYANGSFTFDDILSNHLFGGYVQISNDVKEIGATIEYLNRQRRINWGLLAEHMPSKFVSYSSQERATTVDGETVVGTEYVQLIQRVFRDQFAVLGEFPLTQNQRIEGATGYLRYDFDYELVTSLVIDGETLKESSETVTAPGPIHLSRTSLAYVGDYSFFGFTSPLKGFRYRVELVPTVGSLNYLTARADFRQYIYLTYVSLAFRLIHMGRYLGDSEDPLLGQYYIGNPYGSAGYVRGYEPYSFSTNECSQTDDGTLTCPPYSRLFGTKKLIGNIEVRVPIIGNDQLGLINFPYFPLTLVGFFDAGVAWTNHELPIIEIVSRSAKRVPVFSVGGAIRFNLLGAIVGQLYMAYPFQRPDAGVQVGLVFLAGW